MLNHALGRSAFRGGLAASVMVLTGAAFAPQCPRRSSELAAAGGSITLRTPSRALVVAQITPIDGSVAAAWSERLRKAYPGFDLNTEPGGHTCFRFRTIQSLDNGLVFDSRLSMDYARPDQRRQRIALGIQGAGRAAGERNVRADFSDTRLTGVTLIIGHDTTRFDRLETADGAFEVGLGDLDLRDHLRLAASIRAERYHLLGVVSGLNSTPQVAFDVNLRDAPDASPRGDQPADQESASALVLLDSATAQLRAVRFFDQQGALIRRYSDFRTGPSTAIPFQLFRVDAPAVGSSTLLIVDDGGCRDTSIVLRR